MESHLTLSKSQNYKVIIWPLDPGQVFNLVSYLSLAFCYTNTGGFALAAPSPKPFSQPLHVSDP